MDERNLTKERRLAFLIPEFSHKPGHDVVVVEQEGEGPRLVGPKEVLKGKWYRRAASFVAYAVPRARNLRHHFSRPWQTGDQRHSFTLHYRLELRIQDPVRLVERLTSDPLQQLEDEVDALVGARVRRLAWDVIVQEGENFEDHLLPEARAKTEDQPSLCDSLRDFASDLGLEVTRIGVSRTLPETEPVLMNEIEEKKRLVRDLEHETDLHRERLQLEKEALADRRKLAAAQSAAVRSWVSASGEQGARALGKMVDNIESPGGLPLAVQAVIDGVRILNGAESRPHKGIPGSTPSALLGVGAATDAKLSWLLTELTHQFVRLPCDTSERKDLLSAALHLVGEAIREEADGRVLQHYRQMIDEGFLRNVDVLDREQNQLFKRLKDVAALQRELSL